MQQLKNELLIIQKAFELCQEMTRRVGRLPRQVKFVLGERMLNTTYDVFDALLEAKYSAHKSPLLIRANLLLERLRFQVRLCMEEKLISMNQYGFVITLIDEVGRMTGGWLKSLTGKPDQTT